MKNMMIVLVLCLAGVAGAVDSQWTVTAVGNDDEIALRAGFRPGDDGRGEIGIEGLWTDGIRTGEEAVGCSAYGTWDLMDKVTLPWTLPFGMGGGSLVMSSYVGAKLGVLVNSPGPSDYDAQAAGLLGLRYGNDHVRLGLEVQVPVTEEMIQGFSSPDGGRLMVSVGYAF